MRGAVIRKARVEAALKTAAVRQDGPLGRSGLCQAATDEQIERRVEEDHAYLVERGEKVARSRGFESASAKGQDEFLPAGVFAKGFGL